VIAITVGNLVQDAVDATSLGSLYALVALGIALIFGVMRLINFAHGELIMLAAYSSLFFADKGWVVLIIGPLVVGVVAALAMDRLAFRPVRAASPATLLITSFTLSFLIQNAMTSIFSSTTKAVGLPKVVIETFTIGSVQIPKLSVFTIVAAGGLLAAVATFLKKAPIGIYMRAAAEDFQMARLLGVRANSVIAAAFALSGLLAGVVGLIYVAQTGAVTPTLGVTLALIGFVATVVGGMGSMSAAAAGGFVLGVITVILQDALPINLRPYRDAFLFAAVIIILLARPQGLLVRTAHSRG
jgi:branched-chain amino acid transport system permease protein